MATELLDKVVRVPVALGERSYDILIGDGLIATAGARIAALLPGSRVAVVTDRTVGTHYLEPLTAGLDAAGVGHVTVTVPPGEGSKSFTMLERVVDGVLAGRLERGDAVVALGGGVVGDLAGFVSGLIRRGMHLIQMPTSLLAQVDSSVGGKTGINTPRGKNLVGVFQQPDLVLADTGSLDTLSPREFAAGYAEVAKYGLLGDAGFFAWLENNHAAVFGGGEARVHAIAVSCRAKARIVEIDERETGDRQLLNLGHTIGHALEAAAGYSDRLIHGEAIAIGMALAHRLSARLGYCGDDTWRRVEAHLAAVGLPIAPQQIPGGPPDAATLMELIAQDKKVKRGRLTFILSRGIGQAFIAGPAMSTIVFNLALAFLLLAANGFYVAAEFALVKSRRYRMDALAAEGKFGARMTVQILNNVEAYLACCQLGITMASLGLGWVGEPTVAAIIEPLLAPLGMPEKAVHFTAFMIGFLFFSSLHIVIGEQVPKTLAIREPEPVSLWIAYPLYVSFLAFYPLNWLLNAASGSILRMLGVREASHQEILTYDEIEGLVDVSAEHGKMQQSHAEFIHNVFRFSELEVADIMVHRTNMRSLDAGQSPDRVIADALASPFTRLPIWENEPENIIGVVHVKDLLRALQSAGGDVAKVDVRAIATEPWFVPDTTGLTDQLNAFLKQKSHFALVVDEYGEVQGLVTLEDILEEIVGEIADEHDIDLQGVRPQADGSVIADGAVPIRDLNRVMNWDLPDEEATTVAGLVIHEARIIPEAGQEFTFHGFRFKVLRKNRNRIAAMRIMPSPHEAAAGDGKARPHAMG